MVEPLSPTELDVEYRMIGKQVLDKARAMSLKYRRQMHAWVVVSYDSRPHLGLYIYRVEGGVDLSLVHDYQSASFMAEANMLVDHLNEVRGVSACMVNAFEAIYLNVGRNTALATRLYP